MDKHQKEKPIFFDREAFGERIRRLAEEMTDGSINALAKKYEFTQSTLNQWARGHAQPELDSLEEFSQKSNISLLWLVRGSGPRYIKEGYPVPEKKKKKKILDQSSMVLSEHD